MRWSRRQLALRALVLALAVAGGGLAAELLLRAAGRQPWRFQGVDRREPILAEPDPVLGWRNRPGSYRYPAYADGLPEIEVTILPDGSRSTGGKERSDRPAVLLVGGSFTFGSAVSDRETFAWKLQEAFPEEAWINLAAPGYGTYQSLMTLERWFADSRPAARVIYGFVAHHEDRNVAPHGWMRMLARFSRRGQTAVPWVSLAADGTLVRHPLDRYRIWPLSHRSALVTVLQDGIGGLSRRSRVEGKRGVAQRLLEEMAGLCQRHGSALTVAVLNAGKPARGEYLRFLAERGIASADCHNELTPELRVRSESVV